MPHYIFGQYLGALLGALVVFLLYWEALVWYEHQQGVYRSVPDTATIFSSFPSPHLTHLGGAGDQVLATALLTTLICTLTDNKYLLIGFMRIKQILFSRTFLIHPILLPAVVGCTILGLGTSLGYNCSYPLNPARDLAPRIFMGNKSLRYFNSPISKLFKIIVQPCPDGVGKYLMALTIGGWYQFLPAIWEESLEQSSTGSCYTLTRTL